MGICSDSAESKIEKIIDSPIAVKVERLLEDGVDVRGYMYWTLIDNFEWNFAWELKFGIYEWNPDMGMERRLRDGAKVRQSLLTS